MALPSNPEDNQNKFLFALYDATKGDLRKIKNPHEINHDLEISTVELDELVQSLQKEGYIKHFSDKSPEISLTEEGIKHLERVVMEKKGKIREIFLTRIYQLSGGNPRVDVNTYDLGKELGLSETDTEGIVRYLLQKGYLESFGFQEVFITQEGIDVCEAQIKPKRDTDQKYRIFISRINEHKEISKKLKEFLISIFGEKVEVFDADDPDSIPFSEDWFESIKMGIKNCDLMISLCSPESVKRPWINFEAGGAVMDYKKIGPICFAGQTAGNLPSPLNYIRSQAIDTTDFEKFKKNFDSLIQDIAHHIGIESPTANVLDTEFFKLLSNSRDGKPKKPPIVMVKGF
jgi:Mn-dependent DtxR family transcriptional regulator